MGSQVGQDLWVLSLFPEGYRGFFLDVGCYLPVEISNTYLLEQNGWTGIAFDISDYSKEWKSRKTKFICEDFFKIRFCDNSSLSILPNIEYIGLNPDLDKINEDTECYLPKIIDYLSMDIDGCGYNYRGLKMLVDAGFRFRAITIEHNLYLGENYNLAERIPQRGLLTKEGYTLVKADVECENAKFEDWWTG